MTSFNDIIQLVALIYIIPSYFLYFVILYVIFFSSARKSYLLPFYWLFGFSAVILIIHNVCYYFVLRLTKIPLFYPFLRSWPSESFVYPLTYGSIFYTLAATPCFNVAIAFNRFTIFALKNRYNAFWKRYLKPVIFICTVGPLIMVWNFPFLGIQNRPVENTVAFIVPTIFDFSPWWEPYRNAFVIISISSVLSLGMNFYVVYAIFKLRYFGNDTTTHITSQDYAMFAYSVLIFLTEILVSLRQLLLTIDRTTFTTFALDVQFIAVDINDLVPVWFLLVTNKELRKEVFKFLFYLCNRKNTGLDKVTTVIIVTK